MTAMAMAIARPGRTPVVVRKPVPQAGDNDLVVRVLACGVCRTDLHRMDGDLPSRHPAAIPGHEAVRQLVQRGRKAQRFAIGQRVGIAWLGGSPESPVMTTSSQQHRGRAP